MSLEDLPAGSAQSSSSAPALATTEAQAEADDEEEPSDTIFAAAAAPSTARVILNEPSLRLLRGSTVDYTDELIGSQFKIVGNPRARSSCGCGTSFDVEF
jgi:iron-sulfur cluster assembly accessory protein